MARHSTGYRNGGINNNFNGANRFGNTNNFNRNFAGGWNGGNWSGGNWGRTGFNRGFGYSPYGYGYGLGYPFYGVGYRGFGWGLPFLLGYGLGGYGGYGYGGYGYPYYSNSYYGSSDYGPAYAAVDQTQPLAADTPPANTSFEQQGEEQFKAGDYAGAARSWQHALVDTPDNGTLYLMISQALFATDQYNEAAGALQLGMMQTSDSQWGVVVENYKELYPPNDDYSNQLKNLEKSAKENPTSPAQLVLLGYHYGFLGYPGKAVEKLNQAMTLAPQDMLAQKLRATMAAKAEAKGEPVQPAPQLPKQPPAPAGAAPSAGATTSDSILR